MTQRLYVEANTLAIFALALCGSTASTTLTQQSPLEASKSPALAETRGDTLSRLIAKSSVLKRLFTVQTGVKDFKQKN